MIKQFISAHPVIESNPVRPQAIRIVRGRQKSKEVRALNHRIIGRVNCGHVAATNPFPTNRFLAKSNYHNIKNKQHAVRFKGATKIYLRNRQKIMRAFCRINTKIGVCKFAGT